MRCIKLLKPLEVIAFVAFTAATLSACATGYGAHHRHHHHHGPPPRKQVIAAVHRKNRAEIRGCFEHGEPNKAAQVSEVEVELHLPASGTPASIRLLDADDIPVELRSCLEKVFANLHYGRAHRGATYYQTLQFDPQSGKLRFDKPVDAYHRWGLTGAEIERTLRAHHQVIDQCYASGAQRKKGKVKLTLAIGADGQVARVGVKKTTLQAPNVEDCLIEAVLDIAFPQPRGGGVVVVDVPFKFTPEKGWTQQMHLFP